MEFARRIWLTWDLAGLDEIIEGRRGFFRAFADDHNEAAFLDGLGEKFPVYIDFKPYASARPIHNGIDCALEIRTKYSIVCKDIRKITIYRHPAWADYHLIYNPKNINEAQVSLPFSVAVAFKEGDAFLDHYEDPYLSDPEIHRVVNAVRVEPMEKLPRGVSCLMVVETTNGDKYQSQIDYPRGSRQNPIKEKELIKKFKKLSSNMIDGTSGDRIVEMIFNLDNLKNLNDLTIYFRVGS
jgi:2-methylcitrate dehydratase PrpD